MSKNIESNTFENRPWNIQNAPLDINVYSINFQININKRSPFYSFIKDKLLLYPLQLIGCRKKRFLFLDDYSFFVNPNNTDVSNHIISICDLEINKPLYNEISCAELNESNSKEKQVLLKRFSTLLKMELTNWLEEEWAEFSALHPHTAHLVFK